jgi:hypothetical protein
MYINARITFNETMARKFREKREPVITEMSLNSIGKVIKICGPLFQIDSFARNWVRVFISKFAMFV